MNSKPKVSVLCLTYNQKLYIRDALDSILGQKTDFDIEVLINDDGSNDGTTDIIKMYKSRNPGKIRLVLHKENLYSQGIRNMIIRFLLPKVRGEYIALCEGDDYWTDPLKLQKQVDFLEKNKQYSVCFHPVKVIFQDGKSSPGIFPEYIPQDKFTIENLLSSNFIQTNSVVYRKQKYDKLPTSMMPGDWYLHVFHAMHGKIGFINEIMSVYRRHDKGIWWTNGSTESIIKSQGPGHLELFKEFLNLTSGNEKYEKIVLGSGAAMLQQIVSMSNNEEGNLELVKEYPELSLQSVRNVNTLQLEMETKEKSLNKEINRVNSELQLIYRSRTWKLISVLHSFKSKVKSLLSR